MKNENDSLMMKIILRDLGYTGVGDKPSNQKTFLSIKLPNLVEVNQNKAFEEVIDDSDNNIPSNIIDIYTKLEVVSGLKISGHTDTLTKASNLIDQTYKMGEIQNEQQYRNAFNNFFTV